MPRLVSAGREFHKLTTRLTQPRSIAQAIEKLSDGEMQRLRRKFEVAYVIATENLAFLKYPVFCQLEKKHGVDIGQSYLNERSCREFIHYIAEAKRMKLVEEVNSANFFSVLLDGATDLGNNDNEVALVVWCEISASDERLHTRIAYLGVERPKNATGIGLFDVLETSLRRIGIQELTEEHCKKLVGIGTDGASNNIAARGLKGLVEEKLDWIYWMWCVAHRLELSTKDALKGKCFDFVDDMLIKLYYVYERSPKKCRELSELVADLKEFLQFDDLHKAKGVRPIRATGTRWVSHKLNAMKRILSNYGAYTNHLATLSEDTSVKVVDRAKLKGYLQQWTKAKCLLGCAFFVDLLMPISILRCEDEVYQLQQLKGFTSATQYFENNGATYCRNVSDCVKSRLKWSDVDMMRSMIAVLNPQGWEKLMNDDDSLDEINIIIQKFEIPLKGAGANVDDILQEFAAMIEFACEYIAIHTLHYQSVWWRLFNSPQKKDWVSALLLVELLFSLPASNAKVERVFSAANIIKTEKRTVLANSSLDDLLEINCDAVSVADYIPDKAIQLWWDDKVRRPNQKPRKKYRRHDTGANETESQSESDDDDDDTDWLEEWDNLIESES